MIGGALQRRSWHSSLIRSCPLTLLLQRPDPSNRRDTITSLVRSSLERRAFLYQSSPTNRGRNSWDYIENLEVMDGPSSPRLRLADSVSLTKRDTQLSLLDQSTTFRSLDELQPPLQTFVLYLSLYLGCPPRHLGIQKDANEAELELQVLKHYCLVLHFRVSPARDIRI